MLCIRDSFSNIFLKLLVVFLFSYQLTHSIRDSIMKPLKKIRNLNTLEGSYDIVKDVKVFLWIPSNYLLSSEKSEEVRLEEIKELRNVNSSEFKIFFGKSFELKFLHFKCDSLYEKYEIIEEIKMNVDSLQFESFKSKLDSCLLRQISCLTHRLYVDKETRLKYEVVKKFLKDIDLTVSDEDLASRFDGYFDPLLMPTVKELIEFVHEEITRKQQSILESRWDENPAIKGEYMEFDSEVYPISNFKKFLKYEQDSTPDILLSDIFQTLSIDKENESFITSAQFLDHLFSKQNEVRNSPNPYQDMNRPLSEYFIASSHNTYLTGNQIMSTSSVESYARVLRQGCRCIEIDCWPTKYDIVITHGRTLTSEIALEEVLETIKQHAFATSPYPVVVSLECHCKPVKQKRLAQKFKSIFGSSLVTTPVQKTETCMPSPNQLKRKIILKFKKLDKKTKQYSEESDNYEKILKRGILFVRNAISSTWVPHLFSLSTNSLISIKQKETVGDNDEIYSANSYSFDLWYHGTLPNGSESGPKKFENISFLKDGIFFVAEYEGELHLFVWNDGKCNDITINRMTCEGRQEFTIDNENMFCPLESLISYYEMNDLMFSNQEIRLLEPLYQLDDHTKMKWYHPDISKEDSFIVLHQLGQRGSYLMRKGTKREGDLSLMFCSQDKDIRRIHLCREIDAFCVNKPKWRFPSAVNFVEYFQYNVVPGTQTTLDYAISRAKAAEIIFNAKGTGPKSSEETIYDIGEVSVVSGPDELANLEHDIPVWGFCLSFDGEKRLLVSSRTEEEANLWISSIKQAVDVYTANQEKNESLFGVAKELSDLIVYYQKGNFKQVFHSPEKWNFRQIFSQSANNVNSLIFYNPEKFLNFHKVCTSRVYPPGKCVLSGNYNPLPHWIHGCQMVALNYQTPGIEMQLNEAFFELSDKCGYILRPNVSGNDYKNYPIYLEITVLGARILNDLKTKMQALKIDMNIHGTKVLPQRKRSTILEGDFLAMLGKPERHDFYLEDPEFAFIEFSTCRQQCQSFFGQATIHVSLLREGYRSVPLRNKFSEPCVISSLLIYIKIWRKVDFKLRIHTLHLKIKESRRKRMIQRWKRELEKMSEIEILYPGIT